MHGCSVATAVILTRIINWCYGQLQTVGVTV